MLMSIKRLNKEYCCSPSAKQYAHVLYELGISKEAVGETEKLFEECNAIFYKRVVAF